MMKTWWIVALGAVAIAPAALAADSVALKDENGKVLAVAVVCNECKAGDKQDGKKCYDGATEGWLEDQRCGDCLLESNWGVLIRYPRDLWVTGRLLKDDGQPAAKHYLKMFLPNGWSVRTQTKDDGTFRMKLGATIEREKGETLVINIGDRVDRLRSGNEQFSLYLMPDAYNQCAAAESSK
jgi:hypothetical protein